MRWSNWSRRTDNGSPISWTSNLHRSRAATVWVTLIRLDGSVGVDVGV